MEATKISSLGEISLHILILNCLLTKLLIINVLPPIEGDILPTSPLAVIVRKVQAISTQLASQLKKSLIELPNSSVGDVIIFKPFYF